MDGNKKRSIDGGKRGASIKKSKRMKLLVQQLKLFVLRLIQYLQHHKPTVVEQSILEDLRNHVQLSGATLPSLSLYTFVNTHNGFGTWESLDIQLANLFSRVNMILLRVNKARVQTVGKDIIHFFRVIWVQFIQPLLALLGILICLLQQIQPTVWLWRTELNANLVCYKGHNYPVWDVQSCGTLFGQCFT